MKPEIRAACIVAEYHGDEAAQKNKYPELLSLIIRGISDAEEEAIEEAKRKPVPMLLHCPACGGRHIDEGEFATKEHHTHACQHCGFVWRPAIVPTVGVQFLPGFKNETEQRKATP